MGWEHSVALGIFSSYFLIILGLFTLILRSINGLKASHTNHRSKIHWTFGFLALASLGHTWLHMFRFLAWSFNAYEATLEISAIESTSALNRLTLWLIDTALFEQAWAAVCFGPFNWWWSQQLCLYTVGAWTVLLATKGRERRVPHVWAYMLLGQLVAISVASNLFYLAFLLAPASTSSVGHSKKSKTKPKRAALASPTLYIPVFLSLATIGYSPYTSVASGTFLPNLLLMHTLSVVPLIVPPLSISLLPSVPISTLAALVSVTSMLLHSRATLLAFLSLNHGTLASFLNDVADVGKWRSFIDVAWMTLQDHHPAQSSIGWDVVWTTVSLAAWSLLSGSGEDDKGTNGATSRAFMALATPMLSAGAVAPWVLSGEAEQSKGRKKE
ncbi:hypothetical protein FPV67DRAFT_1495003 [Lyophyllum atratum]|nr:hypothetical protein FPV67DRAFT_1495003 [Lyophyllum atratum]